MGDNIRVFHRLLGERRCERVQLFDRLIDAAKDLARLKASRSLSKRFAVLTP